MREGVLLRGPAGWAEFAPFRDYDDADCVPWLRAAVESATVPWPEPRADRIEVNTTVPVVGAERAADLVRASGCRTAKVKVADPRVDLAADADRLAAVRDALGPTGRIRVDANAGWTVDEAVDAIERLDAAAGGLEYVEQPCRTLAELAAVRGLVRPPIAADESIRRATDPAKVALAGAADIAVIKVAPLGGVRAALAIAAAAGLPVVVSSAVDSSVGLAAGLALAGGLAGPAVRLRAGHRQPADRRCDVDAVAAGRRLPSRAGDRRRHPTATARCGRTRGPPRAGWIDSAGLQRCSRSRTSPERLMGCRFCATPATPPTSNCHDETLVPA